MTAPVRPRVFVACVLPPAAAKPFRDRYDTAFNPQGRILTGDELVAGSAGATILVVTATDRLDAATIARMPPSLRIIGTYSVGTDHVDLSAQDSVKTSGVLSSRTPRAASAARSTWSVPTE
jgi:lactate dehydrogenase-like 2-hydroxyacid dehydrogenase